jgi:hypothetical protein
MALIVLTSANGSPGVTTAALGLALAWPRPVILIDADPTGACAIPSGYFRGEDLGHDPTLVDLSVSHRDGTLSIDLPRMLMTLPGSDVQFLPGLLSHSQAASMGPVWAPLCYALRSLDAAGRDVIVDGGRLGLTGSPVPLLYGADMTLLVLRATLPALRAAATWAETLTEAITAHQGVTTTLGALTVGAKTLDSTTYSARTIARTLRIPVLATVSDDPAGAEVLSLGRPSPRRWTRSPLSKSFPAAASALRAVLTQTAAELATEEIP